MRCKLLFFIICLFAIFCVNNYSSARGSVVDHSSVESNSAFLFNGQLAFAGRIVRDKIEQASIEPLLDLKVSNEQGEDLETQYIDKSGKLLIVSTCNDWKREVSRGAMPNSNADILADINFKRSCGFLFALQQARPASAGFISDLKASISDLELLPINILPIYSLAERNRFNKLARLGISLKKIVASGRLKVSQQESAKLRLIYDRVDDITLEEIGRADFDQDGNEDIFVFYRASGIDGSNLHGDIFILTRGGAQEIFQKKPISDVLPWLKSMSY